MNNIKIDPAKCPQDHICPLVQTCPFDAISQQGFSAPKVDHEKCLACGHCVAACPHQAFSPEE